MKKNTWLFDLVWLTVSLILFFCLFLGARALSVPDEGRYSEIPREMLLLHDFITPHLDGIKYFEKPPLLYWLDVGMIKLFGIKEWALRLPNALLAVISCLAVYSATRFLFTRTIAIFATLILATCPLYFAMAHSLTLDMTVSVFVTLTLLSFIVAVNLPENSSIKKPIGWLMFATSACAVLSKGLIGMVLPGLVIGSWLLIFNQWNTLRRLPLFSGCCLFLLITLPWHILVQIKNPEFFQFYFIQQHVMRYLTKAMDRYQPIWWFVPILLVGLFPWAIFMLQALHAAVKTSWQQRATKQNEIFFFMWAVEIFIFFSLSDSKLIPYILPILPALAILIAKYLSPSFLQLQTMANSMGATSNLDTPAKPKNYFKAYFLLAGILAILSVSMFSLPWKIIILTAPQIMSLYLMAAPLLIMSLGILIILFRLPKKPQWLLPTWLTIMQVIFLYCFLVSFKNFDLRGIKPLALIIKECAKPNDLVVSYGEYPQDLPVYSQHLVLIVNWINELQFGSEHTATAKNYLINSDQFFNLWQSHQRVFAIMHAEDYQKLVKDHPIYFLARNNKEFLVSNQHNFCQHRK